MRLVYLRKLLVVKCLIVNMSIYGMTPFRIPFENPSFSERHKKAPGSDTDGSSLICFCSLWHFRCFFVFEPLHLQA